MKGRQERETVMVLLFAALACALQALRWIIGIPAGAGMVIDLVAVPALIAFFLYGFRSSVAVLSLTALFIALTEPDSWLGAGMKLAATLPMLAIPALYALFMEKRFSLSRVGLSAFFALFIALSAFALWEAATTPAPALIPDLSLGTLCAEIAVPLGDLLLGILPVAAIIIFTMWLLLSWGRHSRRLSPMPFAQPRLLAEVVLVALFIRCAAMIVATWHFAGPLYWGAGPEILVFAIPWYAILAWNAAQGVIEVAAAWLIAFGLGLAEKYSEWR